jgi:hypothetical protein
MFILHLAETQQLPIFPSLRFGLKAAQILLFCTCRWSQHYTTEIITLIWAQFTYLKVFFFFYILQDYICLKPCRVRVAQWVRQLDYPTTHTSLSPTRHGFAPSFVNYKNRCTRLTGASDKVYQLLAHGRWFSPGTLDFFHH